MPITKSDPISNFKNETKKSIRKQALNKDLNKAADTFMLESVKSRYSYNFSWMGRPIIAYPQDMIAMQELIWEIKPDLIIETGVAHGGSIIYYASLLELIGKNGLVVGIDIDIRKHNRKEIEKSSVSKRIVLIEGSSLEDKVIKQVEKIVKKHKTILVCLDSNHTENHVLKELKIYGKYVSKGSYCVVFDTRIEDLSPDMIIDRPWSIGNNPKTAVKKFLKNNNSFIIDKKVDHKLLISVAPDGYLKRVK